MPRGKPRSKASERDFPYDSIRKILSHAIDVNTALVTLTVLAKSNIRAELSEWDIQEHQPALLAQYWASFKPKTRQDVLGIGELYYPFRILRHRRVRGQWQALVQWLGYSLDNEDVSWEPASKLRHDAPDVMLDYIPYVDDEIAKAALLGPLAPVDGEEDEDKEEQEDAKPAPVAVATTPAAKPNGKRKRESLADGEQSTDKRRRSSRYESTPASKPPAAKPSSIAKRNPSETAQTTPKSTTSTRRQSKIATTTEDAPNDLASSARVPARRKSTRTSSAGAAIAAAAAAAAAAAEAAPEPERLSPADIPRTMLWFMDDFTVGDMQKVCRFIDEHCTGKLRLPLYSGGDWDGKAASGRWEDVFMVSPLGRLGRYDDEEEEEKEE
ncbi:hypothetical protein C8034_v010451 [Colletotrichum sidae]|uniref:Chromo domain-containing protein n=1 Tax=Colletotrichum sidae TaxID=1347389 RepID=A0A4R8TM70_9PEZI|nr:hypothetical protein C8034_v010451 [Colletotrichum sidae]